MAKHANLTTRFDRRRYRWYVVTTCGHTVAYLERTDHFEAFRTDHVCYHLPVVVAPTLKDALEGLAELGFGSPGHYSMKGAA